MSNRVEKRSVVSRVAAVVPLVLGVLAGVPIGMEIEGARLKREALEREYAHYDQRTGVWQWGEPIRPEELREEGREELIMDKLPKEIFQ